MGGFYNLDEKMLLDLSLNVEESLVSSNQEMAIISNLNQNLDNTIQIDYSNVFNYEGQKLDSSSSSENIIKSKYDFKNIQCFLLMFLFDVL